MNISKTERRKRIHYRIRKKVVGSATRPRVCVFKSNKSIYCQAIDDERGHTLAAASSLEITSEKGTKSQQANSVGKLIADKLKSKNISEIVFDRGGNLYHGRIKALADGIRENGLEF